MTSSPSEEEESLSLGPPPPITRTTTSTTTTISPVSLLDLAAASLASVIVAADQIVAMARQHDRYHDAKNQHHQHHQHDPHVEDATTTMDKKNVRLKNDGSFVTNADLASQQIIVDALNKISTQVRIVGEESEEEMQLYAITGHEERSQQMYQLCRQEIEMRYHHQQQQQNDKKPLPLAQIHKETNGKKHIDSPWQDGSTDPANDDDDDDLVDDKVDDNVVVAMDHVKRTSIVSTDSAGVGLLLQQPLPEYEVDPNRVSVFIDPLDGTKAYAKGDYEPVSILIAIILDRTPCFGVICKPFGYPGQTSVLDTGCVAIYGGTLLGGAYTAGGSVCKFRPPPSSSSSPTTPPMEVRNVGEGPVQIRSSLETTLDSPTTTSSNCSSSNHAQHPTMEDLPRAVISSGRSKGIVEDFVTHLGQKGMINPQPLLVSGAGEKSLRIILRSENEGLWFFPKAGTSLWDVAASDALLRATGGRLTDKNGNDMDYTKSRTEAENEDGVVACYDQRLHAECIRLFLEQSWQE